MTEQQHYEVVDRFADFELRHYPAHLVAEVVVEGDFADAGNRAFGVLVGFISGRNTARSSVAMTAPVLQEAASERIAMTAPVLQQPDTATTRHRVAFVMPAEYTLDTLPRPSDPRITIREVPAQLAAASTFSGRWTEAIYSEHVEKLRAAVRGAGLEVTGPPRFARFDPPWKPWFLRRNEVVLPVAAAPGDVRSDRP